MFVKLLLCLLQSGEWARTFSLSLRVGPCLSLTSPEWARQACCCCWINILLLWINILRSPQVTWVNYLPNNVGDWVTWLLKPHCCVISTSGLTYSLGLGWFNLVCNYKISQRPLEIAVLCVSVLLARLPPTSEVVGSSPMWHFAVNSTQVINSNLYSILRVFIYFI